MSLELELPVLDALRPLSLLDELLELSSPCVVLRSVRLDSELDDESELEEPELDEPDCGAEDEPDDADLPRPPWVDSSPVDPLALCPLLLVF